MDGITAAGSTYTVADSGEDMPIWVKITSPWLLQHSHESDTVILFRTEEACTIANKFMDAQEQRDKKRYK